MLRFVLLVAFVVTLTRAFAQGPASESAKMEPQPQASGKTPSSDEAKQESDESLLKFLDVRYFRAFVDLGNDGKKEAIVHLVGPEVCGSGGCLTVILRPEGDSYSLVTDISINRPPIRMLSRSSHGWHDLGVWVEGGGITPGYEADLAFDGTTYPENPSTPPA